MGEREFARKRLESPMKSSPSLLGEVARAVRRVTEGYSRLPSARPPPSTILRMAPLPEQARGGLAGDGPPLAKSDI
jgi:hypothetical protein